ncbi:MAG: hypothetical protein HY903_22675 [Deltaproteobacteria bacterium]|nr:hypothetical protein [Deltaproteobacteria bacterium]
MTDIVAGRHGLDVEGEASELWTVAHQSFTLERSLAEYKFGPSFVVCTTPVENLRLTTFFAGEQEVRVVDPRRVAVLEARGCRVAGANRRTTPPSRTRKASRAAAPTQRQSNDG